MNSSPSIFQNPFFTLQLTDHHRTAGITEHIHTGATHIEDTVYSDDQPNYLPCLTEDFLSAMGVTKKAVTGTVSDIPRNVATGEPLWTQFLAVYGAGDGKFVLTDPAPLAPGSAARIFTGAPIPEGADAVVIQEVCEARGAEVALRQAPAPGAVAPLPATAPVEQEILGEEHRGHQARRNGPVNPDSPQFLHRTLEQVRNHHRYQNRQQMLAHNDHKDRAEHQDQQIDRGKDLGKILDKLHGPLQRSSGVDVDHEIRAYLYRSYT